MPDRIVDRTAAVTPRPTAPARQAAHARTSLRATAGAIVATTATYVYFLIFAQFGFLHLPSNRGGGPDHVRVAMIAMGLAGLATSLATGGWPDTR